MKNFNLSKFSLFGAIAIAMTFGTACSDDDDNNGGNNNTPTPPKNEMTHDGTAYGLTKGFFLDYGQTPMGSYNLDLFLFSENLDLDLNTQNFTGSGEFFYVELFTATDGSLEPGVYNFDAVNAPNANTFAVSDFLIGVDAAAQSIAKEATIASGTITVGFADGKYDFTFDLVDEDGVEITGYYKNEVAVLPARIGQDEISKESLKELLTAEVK
jgi:hypothetical protein